jgi:hypothetical protein
LVKANRMSATMNTALDFANEFKIIKQEQKKINEF